MELGDRIAILVVAVIQIFFIIEIVHDVKTDKSMHKQK